MVIFHSYVSLPEGTHGKKPICVQLFEGIAWKRCHNLTYVKLTDYPKKGTSEIDLRLFFFGKSRHGYGSWGTQKYCNSKHLKSDIFEVFDSRSTPEFEPSFGHSALAGGRQREGQGRWPGPLRMISDVMRIDATVWFAEWIKTWHPLG